MRKFYVLPIILFLFSAQSIFSHDHKASIHILSWFHYLSPNWVNVITDSGYLPKSSYYKSSDEALTKFFGTKNDIDLAIVPNNIIPLLKASGFLMENQFHDLVNTYPKAFQGTAGDCLPLSWFFSGLLSNKKVQPAPRSIADLVSLSQKGHKVFIQDDFHHIVTRLYYDHEEGPVNSLKIKDLTSRTYGLKKEHFITSINDSKMDENVVLFGCIGEIAAMIKSNENVNISLSRTRPILQYDSVCIVKNSKTLAKKRELVQIAKGLAEKKQVKLATSYNNYFSPFLDEHNTKNKAILNFYHQSVKTLKEGNYGLPFLEKYAKHDLSLLSDWWKSVRY